MEFNNYLKKCQNNDVLCHRQEELFKIGKFKDAIVTAFKRGIPEKLQEELRTRKIQITPTREVKSGRKAGYQEPYYAAWFEEGVDFQILRAGSEGWQKGKMKINVTLEFCPNETEGIESESPLDDIRKTINQ